ncbi:MAG: potassium-transporting ATPase subunit B, partial [Alphaproteobacteria bacterium]|nr:potassium-transporting ATPase subunit B [Alphaproteobacteria bacterium]
MAGIDSDLILPALWQAIRKLNPRAMVRNPVMFVVEVVTVLTTILFLRDLAMGRGGQLFSFQINLWLWFTLLFANFAEAIAEGRGKAQADTLRRMKIDLEAKLMPGPELKVWRKVPAAQLERGDFVLVEAGDLIPSDGEVVEGVASVNEAAITGESAPVIRESGGDRSAV